MQSADGFIVTAWQNNVQILSNDGGTSSGISVGTGFDDGNWHHIAFTWQRNTPNGFKSYLDGELVEQRQSSDTPLPAFSSGIYLGSMVLSNLQTVRSMKYASGLSHAPRQKYGLAYAMNSVCPKRDCLPTTSSIRA
ncbi:MAG: LamG-like jellyroll fold domain-containing protein [Phaeodactylibacter xiamenensis]|uniref:Laminin G domain-containing protein n=1 Tax=Phaeodactylibacter xiamenensis TaxID=1524460 RepID=A0A098S2X9_9BACT|nr:LamG-like jellyroll fold domain-containing protein [Phaeodactylibacter xiamenensis]KGE86490.1 hypothetical protein IX84_20865 [Phaeodactylibacter xiamenensis]MCR9050848.1 LamG domain-containing protein [bacterium]